MNKLWVILIVLLGSELFAEVQALTESKEGTIWAATENRLLHIHADGKVVTTVLNERIHALTETNGNLWVGTEKGLFRCNGGKCELDSRIPAAPVIELAQQSKSIWIATDDKLYQIQNHTITSAALPFTKLETIAVDQEGIVWIATRSSVQKFQNGTFEEMLNSSAQALATDPARSVWIGSGLELIRWQNGKTELFALPAPPPNVRMRPPITSILPTRSGKLYVGTHNGLLLLSGRSFRKVSDLEVLTLLEDAKGNIWVGNSEGLKRMANGKMINVQLPGQ